MSRAKLLPYNGDIELTWDAPILGETSVSYAYFCKFRDMGIYRTVARVAKEFERTDRTVREMCAKYHWVRRALLYDTHLDTIRRESNEKALLEMNARQAEIGKLMLERGLAAVEARGPADLAPSEAARYIEAGAKLERTARGEPDSRSEHDIKVKGPSWDDVRRSLLANKAADEQADAMLVVPDDWRLPDIPIKYAVQGDSPQGDSGETSGAASGPAPEQGDSRQGDSADEPRQGDSLQGETVQGDSPSGAAPAMPTDPQGDSTGETPRGEALQGDSTGKPVQGDSTGATP